MKALLAALGLFTVLPVRTLPAIDREIARRAMLALPWVGLLLGGLAGLAPLLTDQVGSSGLLGGALALALLAAGTGALHLDGLADTADGLGSRKPAEEALAIMRRSDVGPMGAVTCMLVLLLGVTALGSLDGRTAWAAVAMGAFLGRAVVVQATVPSASARVSGFGALFIGVTSPVAAGFTVVVAVLGAAGLGVVASGLTGAIWFTLGAAAAVAVGWVWARYLARRFGGLTGDTFGSLIEVTQLAFWLVVALGLGG